MKKYLNKKNIPLFMLNLCCIFFLFSCFATSSKKIIVPNYTPWDYLTELNREMPGYAMYTYVLFNRRTKLLEEINPDIAERYKALLNVIENLSPPEDSSRINSEERNIFYIPSIEERPDRRFSIDNYSIGLSTAYVAEFVSVIEADYEFLERFTTDAGPFLISVFSPLHHAVNTSIIYKNDFPLLFADLSDTDISSINNIVAAYRELLIKQSDMDTRSLHTFRSRIVRFFQYQDDKIQVLKGTAD